MGLITKLFGTYSDRELKQIYPIVDKIEALEPEYQALSDEQLTAKTPEFKARLAQGETLDQLLPEAFAAVREASPPGRGQRPDPVQLVGGGGVRVALVLHRRARSPETGRFPARARAGEGLRRADAPAPTPRRRGTRCLRRHAGPSWGAGTPGTERLEDVEARRRSRDGSATVGTARGGQGGACAQWGKDASALLPACPPQDDGRWKEARHDLGPRRSGAAPERAARGAERPVASAGGGHGAGCGHLHAAIVLHRYRGVDYRRGRGVGGVDGVLIALQELPRGLGRAHPRAAPDSARCSRWRGRRRGGV